MTLLEQAMRNVSIPVVFVAFLLTACNDDFTNKDLIQLQDQQLERAVELMNNEGQFASALIKVVTFEGQPIQGARVSLESAGDSTSVSTIRAITDASGNVSFSSVVAGGNNILIEHDEYINLEGSANIGDIQYEVINGQIIPVKSSGSAIIALFPITNSQSASISGQVTIQTDVTTQEREFASDIQVRVSVNPSFLNSSTSGKFELASLYFGDRTAIGIATTDSIGRYSMSVPAPADGITYYVDVPEIIREQVLAVSSRDGTDLGQIMIDTVQTAFGRNNSDTYSVIYQYPGISLRVSEPPVPGRGFSLNFQRRGRDWNPNDIVVEANTIIPFPDVTGHTTSQISSVGAGYVESPLVTITDSTGLGVVAEAFMEFAIQGLTLMGTPTGFGPQADVIFTAEYDEASYDLANPSNIDTVNDVVRVETITVRANDDGDITQDSVDIAVQRAINNADPLFNPESLIEIDDWVVDLRFTNGTTELLVTESIGQLQEVNFISTASDNENYTNPSVSFSLGGASEDAVLDIINFEAQYTVTPDDSNITQAYPGLPNEIQYERSRILIAFGTRAVDPQKSLVFEKYDREGQLIESTNDFWRVFQVNPDSTIGLIVPNGGYVLTERSVNTPQPVVEDLIAERAQFEPLLDGLGGLTAIELSLQDGGQIIDIDLPSFIRGVTPGGNEGLISYGRGYTSPPEFILNSFKGSGASIRVEVSGNVLGYYSVVNAIDIMNPGIGYEKFINKMTMEQPTSDEVVFVQAGDEVIFNFYYGTGERLENVR